MTEKKRSPEGDVIRFFMETEPATAVTVFRIVHDILHQRGALVERAKAARPRVVARKADAQ